MSKVTATTVQNNIKELGWHHLALNRNGFEGAVLEVKSASGKAVGVVFTTSEIYIVEDEQGLFKPSELAHGVVKAKSVDALTPSLVEGSVVIAFLEGDVMQCDEQKLEALGINDYETKNSFNTRLQALSHLDEMVDVKPQA